MKKLFYLPLILLALAACKDSDNNSSSGGSGGGETPDEPIVAFAGAGGGGSYTTGGRGGTIFPITTLDDNDEGSNEPMIPGSLRYALSQKGKKIIVFKVAGIIHLKAALNITNGDFTILGQTAPGDGICIADYPVKINRANNIIIQYLRFRMGDEKLTQAQADGADALSVNNCQNVLIDHCSFSWSTDECCSCYGNENFTLQYCFVTESLRLSKHSGSSSDVDPHGFGGIWGGKNASFHHNLLAHHDSRNPRFDHDYVNKTCRGPLDYVNNVVYNWRGNSSYGGESVNAQRKINFVNNYYKPGPATNSNVKTRFVNPWEECSNCSMTASSVKPPKIYMTGNRMTSSSDVTADNWKGSTLSTSEVKSSTHFSMNYEIVAQSAAEAYETVLAKAGCSLKRDAIDVRIVGEVRDSIYTYKGSKSKYKGIIDSPSDVGGWPTYSGTAATDTDLDGLPDDWETAHNLNPNDRKDAALTTLNKPYMNIEVYAQELVQDLY